MGKIKKSKKAPATKVEVSQEDSESSENEEMELNESAKVPNNANNNQKDPESSEDGDDSNGSSDESDELELEMPDILKGNDEIMATLEEKYVTEDEDEAPLEISSKPPKNKKTEKIVDETEEKSKKAYPKEDELNTVFVGNIPNEPNMNEARIKELFSKFGPIKSVRFRTATGQVIFTQKVKKSATSFNAYVVFTNQDDAESSLQLNGHQLNEHHLRVNLANQYKYESNNKGTIFVGNLPFKATETDVHGHFSKVGNIEYVRILPNKGIAYVCFKKGINMADAVKFNKPFGGRTLRIERYVSKNKQDRRKLFKKDEKTGRVLKQKVKKPHDEKFLQGRSNNNPIIKKIKDSQKAKFNKFTKSEDRNISKKELFRKGGTGIGKKFKKTEVKQHEEKKNQFLGSKVDKKKKQKNKMSKGDREKKVIIAKLKKAGQAKA